MVNVINIYFSLSLPVSLSLCSANLTLVRRNVMQMSTAEKQAFVNALDQAKKTIHPDLVICTRR